MNSETNPRKELRSRNQAIVKAVLEGEKISVVSRQWQISNNRCLQIVQDICQAIEPELYQSLLSLNQYRVPLRVLLKHVDVFMESMEDESEFTRHSPIWRVRTIPTTTTHALLREGIETIGDLERYELKALLRIPAIGKKALKNIQNVLQSIDADKEHQ